MNTILYVTDNTLEDAISLPCRERLVHEAQDIPIVSVSQNPIDLGHNVCVGEIGRSWLSLYKQMLAGLEVIDTDNVVIAEHDCLYTHEHLSYQINAKSIFWYNENHWLVQWHGNHPEMEGMYSYWPKRTALSQLVCSRDLLLESTREILGLIDNGLKVAQGLHFYGEPGVKSAQFERAFVEASSGRSTQLQAYLKEYVTKYTSAYFRTEIPNLDIRHHTNFTGPKRGKDRTFNLQYWGEFKEVIG
jgi:hypothetical protein